MFLFLCLSWKISSYPDPITWRQFFDITFLRFLNIQCFESCFLFLILQKSLHVLIRSLINNSSLLNFWDLSASKSSSLSSFIFLLSWNLFLFHRLSWKISSYLDPITWQQFFDITILRSLNIRIFESCFLFLILQNPFMSWSNHFETILRHYILEIFEYQNLLVFLLFF